MSTQSSASQNNRTRNLGEQLCDDECDGRIITVGHKDRSRQSIPDARSDLKVKNIYIKNPSILCCDKVL